MPYGPEHQRRERKRKEEEEKRKDNKAGRSVG
jgi:hypothetical protein